MPDPLDEVRPCFDPIAPPFDRELFDRLRALTPTGQLQYHERWRRLLKEKVIQAGIEVVWLARPRRNADGTLEQFADPCMVIDKSGERTGA